MKRSYEAQGPKKNVIVVVVGRRGVWTWQATAGVCGVGGGLLAALAGSLMLAAAWLTGQREGGLSLYGVGSGLLISTVPLIMLGAHCLDLSARREAKRRRSNQNVPLAATDGYGHKQAQIALQLLLGDYCGRKEKSPQPENPPLETSTVTNYRSQHARRTTTSPPDKTQSLENLPGEQSWQQNSNVLSSAAHLEPNKRPMSDSRRRLL